ncbi:choice-of-anchor L domain-containing protein [Winogradskyella sediminis]|uniref:choice-of-anchor L domain-containing protein n=1 Tax=Winogradskyella sediminis TaxID=1382466 RepID=UPI000E36AE3D|nr:choice-of-anchor L domain-containing protein [Winogradskyella sediminis]REG88930.1 gliding motility-associated-like protein [Winogradskyella sediminis]
MKNTFYFIIFLISTTSFSQDLPMENGTFNRCAPDIFYDSGGEFTNYGDDENYTTTICPQDDDSFLIVNFTEFVTQLNQDILTIYDGDDITAEVIGTYSGPMSPGFVSASDSNTSGCLTFVFTSNSSGSISGWEAEILCATACQDIEASLTTTPEANASGVVSILPFESVDFSADAIFSVDGTDATYEWDFGDNNTATGTEVSNVFGAAGTYTVTLTVTDTNPQGCSDTVTVTVFVLGPNVVVDQETFTPEELIEDVLIDSPCASVSNIVAVTGTNYSASEPNGIGYFVSNGVDFPFEDGLLLTSGDASEARGPNNNGTLSEGSGTWPGDDDLDTELGVDSHNATYIQFDFTPLADSISFEFLMASEEYDMGGFECIYSDAFAFLLTDSSGNVSNLAVLPGSDTPILVTNIHPDNGESCGGINERYFGAYTPSNGAPIAFDGRTSVFTAQADVVSGEDYTIKLVIADDRDNAYDSGVFIKAGSFNLGGSLGDDITIESGTAPCDGTGVLLDTRLELATHVWYKDGEVIPGEVSSTITVTEPGVYYADFQLESVCTGSSDPILVEFRTGAIANPAPNLVVCSATGTEEFNLSVNDDIIVGDQDPTIFSVSYFLTEQNAMDNIDPLPNPYTNVTSPQTIWARLADSTQTCFDITSFTISSMQEPVINPVSDLELCDDESNNGIETFDLDSQTFGILGVQPESDFMVTYHLSFDDADSGDNALPLSYTNTVNSQPIFVRVTSLGDSSCYNASETALFNLVVNTRALAMAPNALEVCDDISNDGFGTFDLSTQEAAILGSQDPAVFEVSFHSNEDDAMNNVDNLPTTYTNNIAGEETIYVRVENPLYPNCYSITSFDIIVNALPSLVSPTALEVCDDGTPDGLTEMDLSLKNTEITGNNPSYSVSYYENLTDAESEVNPLPTLYTNTSNGQVIYARVEDTITGCFDTTTLELIVQQAPIAFTPQPLRYCDPDNDGLGVFTLTDLDNEITGGASGLEVTYHETEINADNGVDAIDTTVDYNNIVQDYQIIYARVESSTIATDCATIVPVDLIVEPTPQLIEPSALEACDDISADGFATFDLTSKAPELLNGQDPLQYLVSYYETEANAIADNNAISNPMAYTNIDDFNQIIWIRVEDDTTVAGCYKITSLELIVNPLPVLVTPAPLERCDVDNPGDEQEGFILEEANEDILNGQTGITLTYYETLSDAENATNPITSPYVNTSNAQTIFVRAENDNTSCYNTVTVTLRVNPVPSPEPNPTAIEVCDDDNDGFAEFDLEQRTIEVINGEPNVAISYHETQTDAENGENAITGLYTNIVANSQIIYVRSENTITGCYSLTEQTLELIVLPSPEVPTSIDSYVLCDSDDNGITQFDLTTKDAEILNGQDPLEVELTYHVSALDAANGDNPIVNVGSFTNTVNPQTIYVRLFNPTTGCQDTGMFELEVNLPPVAVQPTQLSKCDDLGETPGDEFTIFDLTVKDTEITGGNASWSVAYYETNADAQSQTNAIPDPTQYTNTSVDGLNANPQTLYVVVTDEDTGCVDFTTLTIRVMPNPTPTPSDLLPNIELCDDFNTGDEVEVFDLTENEALILNGEVGVTASYYESLEDANAATNAIPDPTQYTNTELSEQEIYVRVTNDLTDCYALVDFTIIVHPLPEVIAVTDFIQCELFTDGFDSFDLTSKDGEVLNGQDPTQFVVSYHDNLADAEAGINGLVSPYTNISNPQQIFVTITNTVTGCSISTQSFNIEVQEAAQANPNMDPIVYETCDDNMETDGNPSNDSAQFDLTTRDIEVLDGQDAANYVVSYYETQEEADLKVNPLPTLYENIVNPQIIYARVDNDTPDGTGVDTSICYAVAALTLQVNPLPEFNLEDSYTLCLNTNGSEVLDPLVIDTGLSATDYSFEWSYEGTIIAGATGPSIMPSQGGSYSVLVTDMSTSTETNCTNMDITTVIESAPPSLSVELLTQAFADNHVLEAVATGIGVYEYSLDGGPWQDEGVFTNVSTGEHEITARDKNGCGLVTINKFIIDYPLYFTPNGDGNNETWNIEGVGSNAKIYIFDRYGKLLKQLSPDGQGWDGTFNNEAMPTSDYWFTVEYDEPSNGLRQEFKAHFTLKR